MVRCHPFWVKLRVVQYYNGVAVFAIGYAEGNDGKIHSVEQGANAGAITRISACLQTLRGSEGEFTADAL